MAKRVKRQFPRLAVYAISQAELRRALERVEQLSAAVLDLSELVGQLGQEVDRIRTIPARTRRGRVEPTLPPGNSVAGPHQIEERGD